MYLTRRVLDPGTGCPASWTAPPELSEDRPTGGAIQARPAVGPFFARLHFTSLIVPPTWVYPAARCGGLWCTFARADKFICMANRKNRLTATKLISRRARTRARLPKRRMHAHATGLRFQISEGCSPHRLASAVGAGPKTPVSPLQPLASLQTASFFFFLSYSPSDMGLPPGTLRWALVHVCACRQIRLYGKSKKSTHGHQTHLPARTHQRQMASGLFPRPRPASRIWPEKSRVSIQSGLTLDFLYHPEKR